MQSSVWTKTVRHFTTPPTWQANGEVAGNLKLATEKSSWQLRTEEQRRRGPNWAAGRAKTSSLWTSKNSVSMNRSDCLRPRARILDTVEGNCSLSLWRVVRGSKLMHLVSLIHGLFIT
jgi:hypothetical protein